MSGAGEVPADDAHAGRGPGGGDRGSDGRPGEGDGGAVVDNRRMRRLEMALEGGVAFLAYRREPGRLVLVHTEVPDALGGQGLGGRLVRAAVDVAAESGETLVPACSFARSWLERHPDEAARASIELP